MLEKIKKLFEKIRYFFSTEKCFDDMKNRGYVFNGECMGLVGGDRETNFLQYGCIGCPYLYGGKE